MIVNKNVFFFHFITRARKFNYSKFTYMFVVSLININNSVDILSLKPIYPSFCFLTIYNYFRIKLDLNIQTIQHISVML